MVVRMRPGAERDLCGFPASVQGRIMRKLEFYARATEPLRFARSLHDARLGHYRFRIGDYRALFEVVDGTIFILAIKHRKDAY